MKLEAQASKVITLPDIPATKVPGAEYFINFSFCQKRDTEWAKADYEVATEQFKLSSSEKPIFVPEKGNINLNETADALVVKGERFEAVFSKKEGTLSAYTLNNVPLMSKGLELNLFRAPTDNDKQVSGDWQRKGLYQLQTETGKWETRQEEDRITLHIRNCHKGKLGFEYRTEMEYTVNADGSIMVNSVIMPVSDGEIIPRVGYRMELPEVSKCSSTQIPPISPSFKPACCANAVAGRTPMESNTISAGMAFPLFRNTVIPLSVRLKWVTPSSR